MKDISKTISLNGNLTNESSINIGSVQANIYKGNIALTLYINNTDLYLDSKELVEASLKEFMDTVDDAIKEVNTISEESTVLNEI